MYLKKAYLPLIALAAGFVGGFLAAGVHALFFVFLSIVAFAFGYFSSWRWGLMCSFLLYSSYTFALSLIWWGPGNPNVLFPFPYIYAFLAGGFLLLIIGSLAHKVKRGLRRVSSIIILTILVITVGWCAYTAFSHYSYYYQVTINSSENLDNIELYLPVGVVSGKPDELLYRQPYLMPGLTENFAQEIVQTEYGPMNKITIPNLKMETVGARHTANIIFWRGRGFFQSAPHQLLLLAPKTDVMPVDTVTWEKYVWPVKGHESKAIETFQVPVRISASARTNIALTLWNRTDIGEALNFTYTYNKAESYTELIRSDIQSDGQWRFVPVEVTSVMGIRGISD